MSAADWRPGMWGMMLLGMTLLGGSEAPAAGAVENQDILRAKLEAGFRERLARLDGVVGLWVKDLEGGDVFGVSPERLFPTASSIKIAILVELYRQVGEGTLRLNDRHRVAAGDRAGGSGVLGELGEDTVEMTLKDLAILMILVSDNTATNILIDRVGMDAVNATLDGMGLSRTRLRRKMIRPEEQARGNENVSTPEELGRLVEKIYRGEILTPGACHDILDILAKPKRGDIRAKLPEGLRVAHKTGGIGGVRNDVGVVMLEGRPFIVSAMSNLVAREDEAGEAIADVSRLAHDYFSLLSVASSFGAKLPRELIRREH
jgi:beta-lactamase class A